MGKQTNYLRSREFSEDLCWKIVDYYKDNPAYPKDFWKKIKLDIHKDLGSGDFYIRSNLGSLFMNVTLLEEKYS